MKNTELAYIRAATGARARGRKIRLVAARIRELNRSEPSPDSHRDSSSFAVAAEKKEGRRGWAGEKNGSRGGWKAGWRASGHVRQRVYARISHNFPRKFPAQASFSLNSFLSTEARVSTSARGTRFASGPRDLLSCSLPPARIPLFRPCPPFLFRRLHRPRLQR